jgi:hypothetical protein
MFIMQSFYDNHISWEQSQFMIIGIKHLQFMIIENKHLQFIIIILLQLCHE